MDSSNTSPLGQGSEPIAIIGSGCRFPGGANSTSKLWELIKQPRDVLTEIPPSRFNIDGFYHVDSQYPGRTNVRHSYLLEDDVAEFDAQFFNITKAEAVAMDPQQRLLLETVYESLEDAGLTIEGLRGSDTGVYVGVMYVDYESLQFRDLQHVPTYLAIGTARSIVSNRISYFFDWHGPSLTVDTACSSSLVALHQAVQALRAGEVRVALAAGSNLLLGPEPYIHESKLNMLSPDGRSRMWDHKANGYARGDGVASIVLKTLSNALADGDHIEAIVRETGVNQDGRSRGITMPSAAAQAALISATYAKAGLQLGLECPCQYFEAHGTGTPAGDPVEAEAVHTAFFGSRFTSEDPVVDSQPLLVGSIKTVIGHTESTAGLAGILKVVQAIKRGYIPPNLLLERLNPAIEPFYRHLRIPQKLTPWPTLHPGQCRRASVNSFGFGGTNAHVILESFEEESKLVTEGENSTTFTPFVFSAQSKSSLRANLAAHAAYLEEHPHTNAADYSWMLRTRRSRLPLRITFPASTIKVLCGSLQGLPQNLQLEARRAVHGPNVSVKSRILGVFTGQGAQWVRMGAELIETSEYASKVLADLDDVLAQLPEKYLPSWTLRQEMLADISSSNLNKAAVAQPLCTAVQIILVQLLRVAGIEFAAVVGHSSGEISAAYAAGYLSARDAIRIAYLRGWHTNDSASPQAVQGRMLAVGTTLSDAEELCNDEEFVGRVKVAACNSPQSVTLSGDEDAISEMMEIFEDENKFVRMLRVDQAYHSHHMIPCSQKYLESMQCISLETSTRSSSCTWVSSVHPSNELSQLERVSASYWVDNLLSPVLFMQAIEKAVSLDRFDGAIEVGPHPALKGPVSDTLQVLGIDLPYTGLLQRSINAIQSISQAFGYLWIYIDGLRIDFDSYEQALGGPAKRRFIPDLPMYQWNHSQRYWHESSLSKSLRSSSRPVNSLLGDLMPHSSLHQTTWKAILRPRDLPWLHHHRIQGQPVFPAAAYAVVAMEAAPFLAGREPIQLIEIEDLFIHRAVIFSNDQDSGIETRCVINDVKRNNYDRITAHFTFEACEDDQSSFYLASAGELIIRIGEPNPEILPATRRAEPYMVDVPTDLAYSALDDIGYGYTGPFRALSSIKRKLGKASGSLSLSGGDTAADALIIHPACLDAAFHSIILAFSYPNDNRLWNLHLPSHIRRLRINPSLCGSNWRGGDRVPFVATMPESYDGHTGVGFKGDAEIHNSTGGFAAVQVEGLHVVPFTPASADNDQQAFYITDWIDSEPNADIPGAYESTEEEEKLALILERGSYFYLRQLERQIPVDHLGRLDKNYRAYMDFAFETIRKAQKGTHRYAKRDWDRDTLDDIKCLTEPYSTHPEIMAMHVVGEYMPQAIRGETSMLEHLVKDGLLARYYAEAQSVTQGTDILAKTVTQITRRYPRAQILEVGAGTGGATREILKHTRNAFGNYTFTDISAGFFDDAKAEFMPYADQMTFSVLDLENDVGAQGFEKQTFDVVVASFVLHATKSLENTLKRVRSLLKPGGYLVIYEVTNVDIIRGTALFGCLPGWWQGIDEGRTLGACVPESTWDALMRKTGFSGIDSMTPNHGSAALPNSVIVTQAVDDWMTCIRKPLVHWSPLYGGQPILKHLVIVGGATQSVARLIREVLDFVRVLCGNITILESIESFDSSQATRDTAVLVLQDLDAPVFKDITKAQWHALKELFSQGKSILWVTRNRMTDNPFGNMALGFARSALWEFPEIRHQSVDFEGTGDVDAELLTKILLRFHMVEAIPKPKKRSMTWSLESEIVINSQGRQRIPRLQPARVANEHYNSARRIIRKMISPRQHPVSLVNVGGVLKIRKLESYGINSINPSIGQVISLRLQYSSLNCLKTTCGNVFAVLGTCEKSGIQYTGLSDAVASQMQIPLSNLVACSVSPGLEAAFIQVFMIHLLMPVFENNLTKGDILLVHNAPAVIARLLSRHASATGFRVNYTTTSKEDAQRRHWTYIDAYTRESELISRLPNKVSRCIDFTVSSQGQSPIAQLLPLNTDITNNGALISKAGSQVIFDQKAYTGAYEQLQAVVEQSLIDLSTLPRDESSPHEIDISRIEEAKETESFMSILRWDAQAVEVEVQPRTTQFRQDQSYWLFGLSSDLGVAIADWMIENGARFLIITSRRPKIDSVWLKNQARKGVLIRVIPCDVTDYNQLEKSYQGIRVLMPPLAGIYQGSMILGDMALRDLTLEAFTQVLRPKVEGSINLDRLLGDTRLDFLIFFSSTATVAGNPGQVAYTTANMFMSGLALDRRRRGLPSAVLELGLIIGTGYITREKGDTLTRPSFERGLLTISVSDVHQAIAEAIISSDPRSGANFQLSIGLRQLPENAPNLPQWYNYPQFACLTVRAGTSTAQPPEAEAEVSIKSMLLSASTPQEIENVIMESFIAELRKMLHLGEEYHITPSSRTDELGLDSLVAVRVRSWFLSNFQVNIPALRILKGTPLQELITQVVQELPAELAPGVVVDSQTSPPSSDGDSSVETPSSYAIMDASSVPSRLETEYTWESEKSDEPIDIEVSENLEFERFGPLSYTQSVFIFVHQLLEDKSTLNNTVMLRLRGNIEIPDLAQAVQKLGQRHESLRTCILERDGKLVQAVLKKAPLNLEHRKLHEQKKVAEEYELLLNHEFDLSSGQASRVLLLSISDTDHYLLMGAHHVFFDRVSNDTVMADLHGFYSGLSLNTPPLQYLDYSEDQHRLFSTGQWQDKIDFWHHEFEESVESLPLHRSRASERRSLDRYASIMHEFTIDVNLAGQIRQAAKRLQSTPFHFYLAAFKVLLYRFLRVSDVCIGVADSCRNDDYIRTGIGPFLNMLPVRLTASADQKFADAILESRHKSFSVLENSLPLDVILNELRISRQSTHTPLAQAFLNYAENDLQDGQTFLGCDMEFVRHDVAELPYDITFTIINNNVSTDASVILNVQEYLYSQDDAQIIAHGYEDILRQFAAATDKRVGDEWVFRQPLLDKAIDIGRGPSFISTWPSTLVHRFESFFPSVADRVAVVDDNGTLMTYQQLSRQIDAIAAELLQKDVRPGTSIAVFQVSSVQWAASVLAILKIGAVYVPLDLGTPIPRLSSIIEDCRPQAILAHGPTLHLVCQLGARSDMPVLDVSSFIRSSDEPVPIYTRSEAPAIILYTSGSTGVPKGVVLRHDSLLHEFEHCAATYGLLKSDSVLQQSAWSFDLSITQLFLALGVGAKVRLVSHVVRVDSRAVTKLIENEGITTTYATPTEYKSWLRRENEGPLRTSPWRLALVAGEAVTESLLQLFRHEVPSELRLFNVYGPTETTCGSTKMELMYKTPNFYAGTIPVGRASANECFYILDENLNLMPVCQTGEIAIGGVGVAHGYLNNEEQTRTAFCSDPFASEEYLGRGWNRMYRTGDVGYLKPDGTLILKGRIGGDTEVKINGVRVDLRDIEQTVLKSADGLFTDALASLRLTPDGAAKFIVVHVVPSADNFAPQDEDDFFTQFLNELPLPRPICPSAIIPVDNFPRTVAGKIDRKAMAMLSLPQKLRTPSSNSNASVLPRAASIMCDLWETVIPQELMNMHHLNSSSDFFTVGGSSILLIELQHKIRQQLGVSISLLQLFQSSQLGVMAQLLDTESSIMDDSQVDWNAETELSPLIDELHAQHHMLSGPCRTIVLTGATGFLGQHVLEALCMQQQVEKIICIAVRGLDEERRALLSTYSHKIECYEGDLKLPRLGLTEEAASQIFSVADAVVHNGADVSHLKTYSSLRAANLTSTKELARLCLMRKIPLHYISTTGVTMYTTSDTWAEVTVRDASPPFSGLYGYVASKWASEVYLENAQREYELPVYIHRPSSILRPSSDTREENPTADVVQNLMEYSKRIGAVPKPADAFVGYIDLVRPETVTRMVIDTILSHNYDAPCRGIVYQHQSGDVELEVNQLRDYLAAETAKEISELPLDEWIKRAENAGLSLAMATVFRATLGGTEKMNLPRLLRK